MAAAESLKVASEPFTTAVSIDKLYTEISALAEVMKNILIIVQNQEQFIKGQDTKMNIIVKELKKQSRRIYDISGTVEAQTKAISS